MYDNKVGRVKIRKAVGRIREFQAGRSRRNFLNNEVIVLMEPRTELRADPFHYPNMHSR